jgi:ACS family hexuronate transporter-like MFS transporter
MFAMYVSNEWAAVGLVGLATAAHQAFSANLLALPSDLMPKAAVGSVVGIGGTAGSLGGMLMTWGTGQILQYTGSYTPIFIIAGTMYLVALVVMQRLSPRLTPAQLT